jgi:hypothetical protein
MAKVTSTTGVMFLLLAYISGGGELFEGGPRVHRPSMKWSATAESLRNTANNRSGGGDTLLLYGTKIFTTVFTRISH